MALVVQGLPWVSSQMETTTPMTDIQGLEDHFGDMDFKGCWYSWDYNALQMDIQDPRDYY